MAHQSEPRLLALHGLRLKSFAEPDVLADLTGLAVAELKGHLDDLVADGLAIYRDGRMSGYALTPDGRRADEKLLAEELDTLGCRDVVDGAYRRFLDLNHELLEVCTAWQMRVVGGKQVVNDHAEPGYDQQVIGRLVSLHDRVRPLCVDLREAMVRFGGYSTRLRTALEKVAGGETEYFTKPLIDSYHTVWFELHEDLLATLGIDRASEGSH
jgi:hypothetical protein